jgi:hypothetical protein
MQRSNPLLRPDYTKGAYQVYMDVVRHMIEVNGIIFNLSSTFGYARLFYDEGKNDFPSWVPRWDLENRLLLHIGDPDGPKHMAEWRAGGEGAQILRTLCDSRVLSLKGVRLGVVLWTSSALVDIASSRVTIETLWNQLSSAVQTSE